MCALYTPPNAMSDGHDLTTFLHLGVNMADTDKTARRAQSDASQPDKCHAGASGPRQR